MFDWKQQYSVGIDSIDRQHQNLFAIGRELSSAMSSGQGKAAIGRILDRLIQYTKTHFEHEEGLMRQNGFPDYIKHKKSHDDLTARVVKFRYEYQAGEVGISIDVLEFIRNWLEKHIQHEDLAYAPYLKAKAVA
jgi:hemerythrin